MVQNFGRDKRRIEELKRKRREEKRNKKLVKKTEDAPQAAVPPENPLPETP